ncbi:MAG: PAS domain-containing protein, partial [Treponema sp.]|nr:PAS domain-containing protein [Treponema sp.]
MPNSRETQARIQDPLKPVADILFTYLHDLIYKPAAASLDISELPEEFTIFGKGLQYFGNMISETRELAGELAAGNLNCQLPLPTNEIASPLKTLHASLKHLTWQTQQVAKGDYNQQVSFMGDFSLAFNNMVEQLSQKQKMILGEKSRLEMYVNLILVNCPNPILLFDNNGRVMYVSDSFFRYCKKFSKEEIPGRYIDELFEPYASQKALEEIRKLYKNAIDNEILFETEQEINFENAESGCQFKIQITPMLDAENKSAGIIMFLNDMTESILARQNAEHARDMAEQSSRLKSNFLARMSHEIR